MFNGKKNKGQVSLEIVILIGILIAVAIVFAAIFLDFTGKSVESTQNNVDDSDGAVDDFISDLNTYQNTGLIYIGHNSYFIYK